MDKRTEKKKPFEAELILLSSNSDKDVLNGISRLRDSGNEETTAAIIGLLLESPSDEVYQAVSQYLFDMKNDLAADPIMRAIQSPEFRQHRGLLISVFWQSTIDATNYMIDLIEETRNTSYLETVEVLTVLENLDGVLSEDEIFEAIAILNEYLETTENEENIPLFESMIAELNKI